jgi:hypothetical protein
VSKNLGRKGNALYDLVVAAYPETDQAQFVDEVQQSLRRGRFLLLIVGDGIREGAGAIANFLETVGTLEFTFGLVEVALYKNAEVGMLMQPRVVARTVEFQRVVIELPEGARVAAPAQETAEDESVSDRQKFYTKFWEEFLSELRLDDTSQPFAKPTRNENIYFPMPPSGSTAWTSAYFSTSKKRVGVYLKMTKGSFADMAYDRLSADREEINRALGPNALWDDGEKSIAVRKQFADVLAPTSRVEIKRFFADALSRFINEFRPRLEKIVAETRAP